MAVRLTDIKIEVVYNRKFGGFGISDAALHRLRELGYPNAEHMPLERDFRSIEAPDGKYYHTSDIPRNHPLLIQVVKELGQAASGQCADLAIAIFSLDIDTDEYDGKENPKIVSYLADEIGFPDTEDD